jgi:hypothetical protein
VPWWVDAECGGGNMEWATCHYYHFCIPFLNCTVTLWPGEKFPENTPKLGKWYSKAPVSAISQPVEYPVERCGAIACRKEGETIACDHDKCSIEWFHYSLSLDHQYSESKWIIQNFFTNVF